MRWLLLKDLQLLRRSPLVTTLLVLYPVVIAVLIGFALSRGPEKPRVAFLNELPPNEKLSIGGLELDLPTARSEFCRRVECVTIKPTPGSDEDLKRARQKVKDGDVLAALILPEDFISKLESQGVERPTVTVIVNEEDPVKAGLVDDRIQSLLTEANLRVSREFSDINLRYLNYLLEGGEFSVLGRTFDVLGLVRTEEILKAVQGELPRNATEREALQQVIDFTVLARENLDIADELLASVSEPIEAKKETISGTRPPPLNTFTISVAATVSLMFVTLLLVAGSLALEREENAFPRLTRGLIGKSGLLVEKVLLGVICSLVVTLLLLAGLELFVSLDWGRFALWLPAIVAGGAGFAAMGAAIGGATREVRASSLLAFMVSLPIAFLSLVPSGTVSPTLFDVISTLTALFPFGAALDAMSGALSASGPDLVVPLLHLGALTLGYGVLARVALRRFA